MAEIDQELAFKTGVAGSAHGDGDIIEFFEGGHLGAIERRGNGDGAESPAHDIDILFIEYGFEPLQFLVGPAGGVARGEAADEEVSLFGAAMPGAEMQPAQAVIVGDGVVGGLHGAGPDNRKSALQKLQRGRRNPYSIDRRGLGLKRCLVTG